MKEPAGSLLATRRVVNRVRYWCWPVEKRMLKSSVDWPKYLTNLKSYIFI